MQITKIYVAGIIISLRRHNEKGFILGVLTNQNVYYKGWVRMENFTIGQAIEAEWMSKSDDQLGVFKIEAIGANLATRFWHEKNKLESVIKICSMAAKHLPEKIKLQDCYDAFTNSIESLGRSCDYAIAKWENFLSLNELI